MKLKFVATGVNRSGTVFTARLLTSLGIPCGHESIFNDRGEEYAKKALLNPSFRHLSYSSTHETCNEHKRIPNWVEPHKTIGESSYLIVPFLKWKELQGVPLIHIVRNPIKVINSLIGDVRFFREDNISRGMWEKPIYNFFPKLTEIKTQVERACYYYVNWNKEIEKEKNLRPYFFSQVEKLPSQELFKFTGTEPHNKMFNDTHVNHFGKRKKDLDFELSDIPNGEIKDEFEEIISKYGYAISGPKNQIRLL